MTDEAPPSRRAWLSRVTSFLVVCVLLVLLVQSCRWVGRQVSDEGRAVNDGVADMRGWIERTRTHLAGQYSATFDPAVSDEQVLARAISGYSPTGELTRLIGSEVHDGRFVVRLVHHEQGDGTTMFYSVPVLVAVRMCVEFTGTRVPHPDIEVDDTECPPGLPADITMDSSFGYPSSLPVHVAEYDWP